MSSKRRHSKTPCVLKVVRLVSACVSFEASSQHSFLCMIRTQIMRRRESLVLYNQRWAVRIKFRKWEKRARLIFFIDLRHFHKWGNLRICDFRTIFFCILRICDLRTQLFFEHLKLLQIFIFTNIHSFKCSHSNLKTTFGFWDSFE